MTYETSFAFGLLQTNEPTFVSVRKRESAKHQRRRPPLGPPTHPRYDEVQSRTDPVTRCSDAFK